VLAPLYGVLHLTPSPDAAVFVQPGDTVATGQTLCVIEAMKMEATITASAAGIVRRIAIPKTQAVDAGDLILVVEAE
jgi:biotin carboxyl carrier protein